MKRCFAYVRVSTQKQGEGVSLEAQKDAIVAYAQRNNLRIVRWFEEMVTAAKQGRPAFNAMMKLLMRGSADGLVVHKIDRSARNFADWAKIGDLSDAGIDVHFASESLDFRSRGGRLAADIQAVIAADYIRNLRDECLKGMNGRLKQGLYPWAAPIGYLDMGKGKAKALDQERTPLMRTLFELYASGQHSIRSLQREMKLRGLRNRRGRPLSKKGIETILSNPFYTGIIRVRTTGETFSGIHQPLIPASLFERIQQMKAGKAGKKVTRHNHTYRGLFRCGHCQGAMNPELQKGHVYYRCHVPTCPTTTVREDQIEAAVTKLLTEARIPEEQYGAIEQKVAQWLKADEDGGERKRLQLSLDQLDSRLDHLADVLIDNLLDRDTYLAKKERLLFERHRLAEELATPRSTRPNSNDLRRFLELVKTLAQSYDSATRAEKRQIVELTTSNRVVLGKKIRIQPQDWLLVPSNVLSVSYGGHHRPTSRTGHEMLEKQMECLFDAIKSDEAITLLNRSAEDEFPLAA